VKLKGIVFGSLWSVVNLFLSLTKSLLLVPLFLTIWESDDYAIWILLLSLALLIQGFNLGFIQYAGNEINLTFHRSKDKAIYIFSSATKFLLILFSIEAFIALFFYNEDIQLYIFNDIKVFENQIILPIFIYSCLVYNCILRFFPRLFEPIGRVDLLARINLIFTSLELLMMIISLSFLKTNLNDFILIISLFYLSSSFLIFLVIKKRFNIFFNNIFKGSTKYGGQIFLSSLGFFFTNLIEKLNNESISLIIAKFISISLIPLFYTTKTFTNLFVRVNNISLDLISPYFQKYFQENRNDKIILIHRLYWLITSAPIFIIIIVSLPYIQYVFDIWVQNKINFDYKLYVLFLISISIISYGTIFSYFLKCINRVKLVSISVFLKTIFFYFTFIFCPKDLYGFLIAFIVSDVLLYLIIYRKYVLKILKSQNNFSLLTSLIPLFVITSFLTISFFKSSIYINLSALTLLIVYYSFEFFLLRSAISLLLKKIKNI